MKIHIEYLQTLGYLLRVAELYAMHVRARRLTQTFRLRGLRYKDIHRQLKYKNNHMAIFMEYLQALGHLLLFTELCAPHVRARRERQTSKPNGF